MIFDGARENWEASERHRQRYFLIFAVALIAGMCAAAIIAHAAGRLVNCSQTVGTTAANIPFPNSPGPAYPTRYLEICDAHPTNTLGVNISGGTAAIGAAGTVTLQPGGCLWWNTDFIPGPTISVVGSGAGTTTACGYQ